MKSPTPPLQESLKENPQKCKENTQTWHQTVSHNLAQFKKVKVAAMYI